MLDVFYNGYDHSNNYDYSNVQFNISEHKSAHNHVNKLEDCFKSSECEVLLPVCSDSNLVKSNKEHGTTQLVKTLSDKDNYNEDPYCNLDNYNKLLKKPTIAKMNANESLTAFQKLDIQAPLLEYLVRHHAISQEASDEILKTDVSEKPSKLLDAIGFPILNETFSTSVHSSLPPPGLVLLLNALRQAGHHELASYLDCSRRIVSYSTQSNTSFQNSIACVPRRHGQISICVQLLAIKVCPSSYQSFCASMNHTIDEPKNSSIPLYTEVSDQNVLSISDSLSHCQESAVGPSLSKSIWIDHAALESESPAKQTKVFENRRPNSKVNTKARSKSNLLHLFFCCFSDSRARHPIKSNIPISLTSKPLPSPPSSVDVPQPHLTTSDYLKTNDALCKQNFVDFKSDQLNQILLNSESQAYDALVKYLEQSLGLLVLNCQIETNPSTTALRVDVVATQRGLIRKLIELSNPTGSNSVERDECSNAPCSTTSKLAQDLAGVLIRAGVLDQLELQNICLSVTLNSNEVQLAIKELIDLNE